MVHELEHEGRKEPNFTLDWWCDIERSSVVTIRKRKLSHAPICIDVARAFLSIQASSASGERLFGDAGYQEGSRRQTCHQSLSDMLLLIRSYVLHRLKMSNNQSFFLGGRAQTVKELAIQVASRIE